LEVIEDPLSAGHMNYEVHAAPVRVSVRPRRRPSVILHGTVILKVQGLFVGTPCLSGCLVVQPGWKRR